MTEMETWARYGACRGRDPEDFFDSDDFVDGAMTGPERNTLDGERRLRARMICSTCHVRAQCLQDALDDGDQFAVRGGYTARERQQMLAGERVETYHIKNVTLPNRTRGWSLVQRFAAGERLVDLCAEYGLQRTTALQEIRLGLVTGKWQDTEAA